MVKSPPSELAMATYPFVPLKNNALPQTPGTRLASPRLLSVPLFPAPELSKAVGPLVSLKDQKPINPVLGIVASTAFTTKSAEAGLLLPSKSDTRAAGIRTVTGPGIAGVTVKPYTPPPPVRALTYPFAT